MLQDVPNEKQKERSGMFATHIATVLQYSFMSLKQTCESVCFTCFLGAKSEQISNSSKEDADFIGPYADIRVSLLHI